MEMKKAQLWLPGSAFEGGQQMKQKLWSSEVDREMMDGRNQGVLITPDHQSHFSCSPGCSAAPGPGPEDQRGRQNNGLGQAAMIHCVQMGPGTPITLAPLSPTFCQSAQPNSTLSTDNQQ